MILLGDLHFQVVLNEGSWLTSLRLVRNRTRRIVQIATALDIQKCTTLSTFFSPLAGGRLETEYFDREREREERNNADSKVPLTLSPVFSLLISPGPCCKWLSAPFFAISEENRIYNRLGF
jgi:hypothetical protein